MSRISEKLLQEQQDEFELEFSYQEWLRDNTVEPTSEELDEMERTMCIKGNEKFNSSCQ